jgi:hypothetical protein
VMPQPCMGSSWTAFRMSISSVPWRRSLLSFATVLLSMDERRVARVPFECQGERCGVWRPRDGAAVRAWPCGSSRDILGKVETDPTGLQQICKVPRRSPFNCKQGDVSCPMPDPAESAKPSFPVQIRAPPLFLGPFRSDGQQVCSTPRTRTGWWRIPAAASDLTQDLHRCVAIEEPRQGGAGRLSSAPTNERTKPGRRGDRVSFQYACDRCTSPQGSRTASTGAKKSPSIASCSHCQGSSPSRSR